MCSSGRGIRVTNLPPSILLACTRVALLPLAALRFAVEKVSSFSRRLAISPARKSTTLHPFSGEEPVSEQGTLVTPWRGTQLRTAGSPWSPPGWRSVLLWTRSLVSTYRSHSGASGGGNRTAHPEGRPV